MVLSLHNYLSKIKKTCLCKIETVAVDRRLADGISKKRVLGTLEI